MKEVVAGNIWFLCFNNLVKSNVLLLSLWRMMNHLVVIGGIVDTKWSGEFPNLS